MTNARHDAERCAWTRNGFASKVCLCPCEPCLHDRCDKALQAEAPTP